MTVAAALALAWRSAITWPDPSGYALFAALLAGWALSVVQVPLIADKGRVSLGFAPVLFFTLVWGPAAGALVGVTEGVAGNLGPWMAGRLKGEPGRALPLSRMAFNGANHALSAMAAGWVYLYLHNGVPGVTSLDASGPPAMAGTLTYYLVNTWLTAAILSSVGAGNVRAVWRENFEWTLPAFLMVGGIIVLALSSRYHGTWKWSAVTLGPALYFVLYSYRLVSQKREVEQAHVTAMDEMNHSIVMSLANAINAKDRYSTQHPARVQMYAVAMAEHLRLPSEEREAVRCASLVHDIGKIGVPEHILQKPGPLTPDEYRRVQEHVEIGVAILSPVRFPWPVVETVQAHHERWDGQGYPRGLRGEEIPLTARIISVADVFDALSSERPYRPAMSADGAVAALQEMAGSHFDPRVVESLLTVLPECRSRLAGLPAGGHGHGGSEADSATPGAGAEKGYLAMYTAGKQTPVTLDLRDALGDLLERAQSVVPCSDAVVYLPGEEEVLTAFAARGIHAGGIPGTALRATGGPTRRAFDQGSPVVNGDPQRDLGSRPDGAETLELRSALAYPLRAGEEAMGVLTLYSTGRNAFTPEQARLVAMVADHAAGGIHGALRFQQTEEMAYTDPLTGLPNARALNAWLSNRLELSRMSREPFSVVLADLDHFKLVNDTMGHLAGDEALREVAAAMKACVRAGDVVARYAGDEFVLGLQTAGTEALDSLHGRVTTAIDTVARTGGFPFGISLGYAVFPEDGLCVSELLQVADTRMYEEKRRKRLAR